VKRKVTQTPRAAQRLILRAVIVLMATLLLLAIFRAHAVFGQSQAPTYVSEFSKGGER
jgi:hypothetical protein